MRNRVRQWWQGLVTRAFRLGRAIVQPWEQAWGHDPSTFAPEEYGEYLAKSVGVYACAEKRAKNLAGLPIRGWKLDGTGQRREVVTGQLMELLRSVNPFWTFKRLVHMTELSLCSWGSAFWVLERGQNGKGTPREIWWARPDWMRVIPDPEGYIAGFVYEVNGERLPFLPSEVIWFRYPNPIDEFSGLSPIAAARLQIETNNDATKSNRLIFQNGLQTAGLVSPDDKDTRWTKEQVDELQLLIDRRLKGVNKAHRIALLSRAMKFQQMTLTPKDAEFLGQLQWGLNDICRVFDVPPPVVQDFSRATYANVTEAHKAFWTDCLLPEADFLSDELTEQLQPMFANEVDLLEFDTTGIAVLQEDRSEIVDQMHKLWQMGVPLNRLLQEFQPNLLPDGEQGYSWGDVGYLPVTLAPAGEAPALPPGTSDGGKKPATTQGIQAQSAQVLQAVEAMLAEQRQVVEFGGAEHQRRWKAFADRTEPQERLVREAVIPLFERQREAVLARLRQARAQMSPDDGLWALQAAVAKDLADAINDPFSQAEWGRRFAEEIRPLLLRIVGEAGRATSEELEMVGAFNVDSPEAIRWLSTRAQRFAREVNETTWEELRTSLTEGLKAGESIDDLAARVRQVFGDATTSRAETIARTEVLGASNAGSLLAAQASGVVESKVWLSTLDDRVRDTHRAVHGQERPLDKNFDVGGCHGAAPGQIDCAKETIRCRCTMTWKLKTQRMVGPPVVVALNGHGAM